MSNEHDPGGKVRVTLPNGVLGTAEFSPCGRYRHLLTRQWGPASEPIRVVWIGMNPSTATADVDDPTMIRVRKFTERFGFSGYAMVNVMDYRATDQNVMRLPAVSPASPDNLAAIKRACVPAAVIVAAWGAIHKSLRRISAAVEIMLRDEGYTLTCLGYTKDGSPRHPLYMRGDARLLPYPRPLSAYSLKQT